MTTADCDDLSACFIKAAAGSLPIKRTLGNRAVDFMSVEDFGCVGDGVADDRLRFQDALNWSTQPGRAVYASRKYLLGSALNAFADTTLICTPSARIIRAKTFGSAEAGGGGFLLTTGDTGEQADVWIEGGRWGYDYPGGRKTWKPLTVTFAYEGATLGTSILTFASGLQFSDFDGYTQAVWLSGVSSSANNDQVFAFATTDRASSKPDPRFGQGRERNGETRLHRLGRSAVGRRAEGQQPRRHSARRRAGQHARDRLPGRRQPLPPARQLLAQRHARCGRRRALHQRHGPVRQRALHRVERRLLPVQSQRQRRRQHRRRDDRPRLDRRLARPHQPGRADRADQRQWPRLRGGAGFAHPASEHPGPQRQRGHRRLGAPRRGGGQDLLRQLEISDHQRLDRGRLRPAGRHHPAGHAARRGDDRHRTAGWRRPRLGRAQSRGREPQRSAPRDHPADDAPEGFSKAVDFTLEQARAPGKGTQAGEALIAAPYADRLVLRDVSGDLSGGIGASPGRALEIGVATAYPSGSNPATIAAGTVKSLVTDGLETTNAALPATDGSGNSMVAATNRWREVARTT